MTSHSTATVHLLLVHHDGDELFFGSQVKQLHPSFDAAADALRAWFANEDFDFLYDAPALRPRLLALQSQTEFVEQLGEVLGEEIEYSVYIVELDLP